jgi:hypothetical protein
MSKANINLELKVEKGIPLPNLIRERTSYPFFEMEIGDSFEFPKHCLAAVTSAATQHGRRHDRRMTIRKISDTHYRCWRVK